MLNKDFLRQILVDDKKLLTLKDVKWIEAPRYEELSVTNLLPKFAEDESVMIFFPDRLPKGRLPDRAYFFNILNTVHEQYTQELISVAQRNRHQASQNEFAVDVVKATDEWFKKLTEIPFTRCK